MPGLFNGSSSSATLGWCSTSSVSWMVKGETETFRGSYSGDSLFWRGPNVALPESELHSGKAGAQEKAYREAELILEAKQYIGKGTEKKGSQRAPQCSSRMHDWLQSMRGQDNEGRMRCMGSGPA